MAENELQKRLFSFGVTVLKYLPSLPKTPEFSIVRYQLAKCSTSSGANYEEAQAGSSKADFNNKVRISLREMRESNYWLRVVDAIISVKTKELTFLLDESAQLKNILGSIVNKTNSGGKDKRNK